MANPLTKVLWAQKDFWLREHIREHAKAPPRDSRTAIGSVSGRKGLISEGNTLKLRSIHQRQDRPAEPQLTQHAGVQRRRRLHGYSCAHLGQARRHHQTGVGTGKARKGHRHARAHSGRQRSGCAMQDISCTQRTTGRSRQANERHVWFRDMEVRRLLNCRGCPLSRDSTLEPTHAGVVVEEAARQHTHLCRGVSSSWTLGLPRECCGYGRTPGAAGCAA